MSIQAYSEAELYDIAFSYRNYEQEVSTLVEWFQVLCNLDRLPRSSLELASGPGRHAIALSMRNIETVAVDLSTEMSSYSKLLAKTHKTELEAVTADMVSFELNREFDLILTLINSICHILSEQDLVSHFKSVARHLSDSGIYVVEAARNDSSTSPGHSEWHQQVGKNEANIYWGWDDHFDYVKMVGQIDGQKVAVNEQFPMKRWTTAEIASLATKAGLQWVAHSGNFEGDYSEDIEATKILPNETSMHSCFVFAKQ